MSYSQLLPPLAFFAHWAFCRFIRPIVRNISCRKNRLNLHTCNLIYRAEYGRNPTHRSAIIQYTFDCPVNGLSGGNRRSRINTCWSLIILCLLSRNISVQSHQTRCITEILFPALNDIRLLSASCSAIKVPITSVSSRHTIVLTKVLDIYIMRKLLGSFSGIVVP